MNTTIRRALLILCFLSLPGTVSAGMISTGTPTTSIPGSLFDPAGNLPDPLPANAFLLPIEITGANGLQDWSFDLNFADGVVSPLDVGGFFQSVYQAEFNASDSTLSNITSGGFLFTGSLQGIAGFSSGVSGDGLLAFVLFEQLMPGVDPAFSISNEIVHQTPEPGTLALLLVLTLIFPLTRRRAAPM